MSKIVLEIREGVGGEEASLFALELMQMYQACAAKQKWKVKVLNSTPSKTKGIKTATLEVSGENVDMLRFEGGVHRVQRVPATEAKGRVHTSTATVAVLEEKVAAQVKLDMNDVEITTCRSSGAGGQHVNKTESAIRAVHKPTGIVVECQDERSQIQNKARALEIIQQRVQDFYQGKIDSAYAQERRDQVGNGDRCEKIRTYNFPQDRITDHRLNKNFGGIDKIMGGNLIKILKEFEKQSESWVRVPKFRLCDIKFLALPFSCG